MNLKEIDEQHNKQVQKQKEEEQKKRGYKKEQH